MKKILIINAHPLKDSFCAALAQSYKSGAEQSGASCKFVNLIDLNFDPIMRFGYKKRMDMEPDLVQIQQDIADADHLGNVSGSAQRPIRQSFYTRFCFQISRKFTHVG